MTAISAAAMRCKTMSDGSLRIEVEVEPQDAQKAFALFGKPGAPMALAALAEGHAAVREPEQEQPKGGERAKWVAMRCREHEFQDWLCAMYEGQWIKAPAGPGEVMAADVVRAVCGCASRAALDSDPVAADKFERLIRKPWAEFNKGA